MVAAAKTRQEGEEVKVKVKSGRGGASACASITWVALAAVLLHKKEAPGRSRVLGYVPPHRGTPRPVSVAGCRSGNAVEDDGHNKVSKYTVHW